MLIKIATDFSELPGARYEKEGPFSGERFRDEILLPKYLEAVQKKVKLTIDLDDCFGFATSFLEESFGGLVRKLQIPGVLQNIIIISNDDLSLPNLINKYVKEAEQKL